VQAPAAAAAAAAVVVVVVVVVVGQVSIQQSIPEMYKKY